MLKNIVIIGASVAGLSAALRIRRLSETVNITLIEKDKNFGYKIQGLPYLVAGMLKKIESLYYYSEDYYKNVFNLTLYTEHEANNIDREGKIVSCKNINTGINIDVPYDILILATGFSYTNPIAGKINYKNVFIIKNIQDALKIKKHYETSGANKVAVIGNNTIGFETAKIFFERGFEVSFISSNNLARDLSSDFNFFLKTELQNIGLSLYTNAKISSFIQKRQDWVSAIKFEDGYEIETQFIILCYNPIPNISLAKKADLTIGDNNGIKVDSTFTTNDSNIKAIGSVVEYFNPLIGKYEVRDSLKYATADGRAVADIIMTNNILKRKNIFITKLYEFDKIVVGRTGLQNGSIDMTSSNFMTVTIRSGLSERFVASSSFLILRITVEKDTSKIIQAEIAGIGAGIQRRLDILHVAIVSGMSTEQLIDLDISYTVHSGMNNDPINILGMITSNIVNGITNYVKKQEVQINENIFIIDLRGKSNIKEFHTKHLISITIQQLREKLDSIPKEKEIYVVSNTGRNGYIAERMLRGNGFEKVYNVFCGFKETAIR